MAKTKLNKPTVCYTGTKGIVGSERYLVLRFGNDGDVVKFRLTFKSNTKIDFHTSDKYGYIDNYTIEVSSVDTPNPSWRAKYLEIAKCYLDYLYMFSKSIAISDAKYATIKVAWYTVQFPAITAFEEKRLKYSYCRTPIINASSILVEYLYRVNNMAVTFNDEFAAHFKDESTIRIDPAEVPLDDYTAPIEIDTMQLYSETKLKGALTYGSLVKGSFRRHFDSHLQMTCHGEHHLIDLILDKFVGVDHYGKLRFTYQFKTDNDLFTEYLNKYITIAGLKKYSDGLMHFVLGCMDANIEVVDAEHMGNHGPDSIIMGNYRFLPVCKPENIEQSATTPGAIPILNEIEHEYNPNPNEYTIDPPIEDAFEKDVMCWESPINFVLIGNTISKYLFKNNHSHTHSDGIVTDYRWLIYTSPELTIDLEFTATVVPGGNRIIVGVLENKIVSLDSVIMDVLLDEVGPKGNVLKYVLEHYNHIYRRLEGGLSILTDYEGILYEDEEFAAPEEARHASFVNAATGNKIYVKCGSPYIYTLHPEELDIIKKHDHILLKKDRTIGYGRRPSEVLDGCITKLDEYRFTIPADMVELVSEKGKHASVGRVVEIGKLISNQSEKEKEFLVDFTFTFNLEGDHYVVTTGVSSAAYGPEIRDFLTWIASGNSMSLFAYVLQLFEKDELLTIYSTKDIGQFHECSLDYITNADLKYVSMNGNLFSLDKRILFTEDIRAFMKFTNSPDKALLSKGYFDYRFSMMDEASIDIPHSDYKLTITKSEVQPDDDTELVDLDVKLIADYSKRYRSPELVKAMLMDFCENYPCNLLYLVTHPDIWENGTVEIASIWGHEVRVYYIAYECQRHSDTNGIASFENNGKKIFFNLHQPDIYVSSDRKSLAELSNGASIYIDRDWSIQWTYKGLLSVHHLNINKELTRLLLPKVTEVTDEEVTEELAKKEPLKEEPAPIVAGASREQMDDVAKHVISNYKMDAVYQEIRDLNVHLHAVCDIAKKFSNFNDHKLIIIYKVAEGTCVLFGSELALKFDNDNKLVVMISHYNTTPDRFVNRKKEIFIENEKELLFQNSNNRICEEIKSKRVLDIKGCNVNIIYTGEDPTDVDEWLVPIIETYLDSGLVQYCVAKVHKEWI